MYIYNIYPFKIKILYLYNSSKRLSSLLNTIYELKFLKIFSIFWYILKTSLGGFQVKSITSIYVFHLDAPDVSVEEHWRHREEGKWDVELHCTVQSNPDSQVLHLIINMYI